MGVGRTRRTTSHGTMTSKNTPRAFVMSRRRRNQQRQRDHDSGRVPRPPARQIDGDENDRGERGGPLQTSSDRSPARARARCRASRPPARPTSIAGQPSADVAAHDAIEVATADVISRQAGRASSPSPTPSHSRDDAPLLAEQSCLELKAWTPGSSSSWMRARFLQLNRPAVDPERHVHGAASSQVATAPDPAQ